METRSLTQEDFGEIASVIDRWWGGPSAALAHPLFLHELGDDALVVEDDGLLVGFLLGFVTAAGVGYVHLVGIHNDHRRRGIGRRLYESFTARAQRRGARRMKAITTPGNHGSVEFHRALGYGVELAVDYAGPARDRYVFTRELPAG
ncbi:MAG: GNAT family N-acetyltransferase [Deltaproteobacteria bacterium]|nr:GNAT family N-acetyltransferase [Myxococcales bacterium]MDP3212841.1 GNAT family N-acetyltransferase [Deltaproteobacteria bacterium]